MCWLDQIALYPAQRTAIYQYHMIDESVAWAFNTVSQIGAVVGGKGGGR